MRQLEKKHVAMLLLAIGILVRCGGGSATGSLEPTEQAGPKFRISTARPPVGNAPETNWCHAPFDGQVLVNAEQINTNRRYFYLMPGVVWLTAERDNARANLYLRPLQGGDVEVFTGANFPYCLSRPDYVRVQGENPATLRYDNGTNIDFNLDVQTDQGRPKVTLEFRPGTFYAINVLHCPECR